MEPMLPTSLSAGYMTNLAARLFARAMDRQLRPHGLSSGQLPVFFALGEGQALSQKVLVEIAQIEQPTMAATLTRMERDGLVQRAADPQDGRKSLISLTPQGRDKVSAVRAAVSAVNNAALAAMSPQQRDDYLRLLGMAAAALASGEVSATGAEQPEPFR